MFIDANTSSGLTIVVEITMDYIVRYISQCGVIDYVVKVKIN